MDQEFNHMAEQKKRRLMHVWRLGETVAAYEIADENVLRAQQV